MIRFRILVPTLLGLALGLPGLQAPVVRDIDASLFDAHGDGVRSFVREATIQAPAEEVWLAWTDGERFRQAYDPSSPSLKAHIDLAIGGRYEWLWDGVTGGNGCQVLSYIPERMVSFSWNAPPSQPESRAKHTWVVVELEPLSDASTHVRITHLGFGAAAHWDETFEYFSQAWPYVLQQFQRGLERED